MGKRSKENVNRYEMNKKNNPFLGLRMGSKNKAITIQCPRKYMKKEETVHSGWGEGIQ
jgi:hypothetical protein